MITTVTLNPAIDRTIILDSFKHGSVNRVKSMREDIGGKGINVARVLQTLGYNVWATGFIGEGNSHYVQNLLANEELENEFLTVEGQTRLNIKIVEMDTKLTTDINELGFHISEEELSSIKQLIIQHAQKSEMLVFSGSLPQGLESDVYFELLNLAGSYTKTALDADGEILLKGLKASPYVIKPNIHELESAISRKLHSNSEIKEAARELIGDYGIKYVLVSMGGDGSILVSADEALFAKALKVDVKSSVGAGDSMLAGFIYGITNRAFPVQKALAYATACGALAVSQEGTQAFKKEDVESLIEEVEISSL